MGVTDIIKRYTILKLFPERSTEIQFTLFRNYFNSSECFRFYTSKRILYPISKLIPGEYAVKAAPKFYFKPFFEGDRWMS